MKKVSLSQAANVVKYIGTTNTVFIQGRPGIGKSSILAGFEDENYIKAYIDCANLDLGDLGMPVVQRDVMETQYAPNARFRISESLRSDKPVVIMLDELSKSPKPVLNMLLPLMLERRLADVQLHPDSVVFATGNLASDGVGDNIPAHAYNRMTTLTCSGPTSDEWCEWAFDAGIDPTVIVFAKQTPQLFHCYTDYTDEKHAKENPYIFNPLVGNNKHFASPRSLHKASHIVTKRDELKAAFVPALEGTIGSAAASDFAAYLDMQDSLESFDRIVKDPSSARTPNGVAYFMQAYRLASRVAPDNIDSLLTYVKRWTSEESAALFAKSALQRPGAMAFLAKHRAFAEMAARFGRVLG